MKFHIVRNGETLDDILFIYNLSKEELKEQNRHIRVWEKLIPGTKLRIPPIPEAVEIEVAETEPFVEDYYPKLNQDLSDEIDINKLEDKEEEQKIDEQLEIVTVNESAKSSTFYEDYVNKDVKFDVKQEQEKKVEEKKEQVVFQSKASTSTPIDDNQAKLYSNMQLKPIVNNFYPYYLGYYNSPRYIPYSIIYYPIYYKKPQ